MYIFIMYCVVVDEAVEEDDDWVNVDDEDEYNEPPAYTGEQSIHIDSDQSISEMDAFGLLFD